MTGDCVDQPKLLAALRGARAGDFGVRLPLDWTGVPGTISEVFNEVVERNQAAVDRALEGLHRVEVPDDPEVVVGAAMLALGGGISSFFTSVKGKLDSAATK